MNTDSLLKTMFVVYLEKIRDHLAAAIDEVETHLPEDTPREMITKYVGPQKSPFDFSMNPNDYIEVPQGKPVILSNLNSLLDTLNADIETISGSIQDR